MKTVVSNEQMRRFDSAEIARGTPSVELMRRAGEAVFESYAWQGPVAIVCGTGNNAGDGYVLALCLKRAEIPCRLLLLEEKFSPDGAYYFQQCKDVGVAWSLCDGREEYSEDREIVDCIFGTGFHGHAVGPVAEVIERINASGKPVIAVDINSGLDGTSGLGSPCVRSALTVAIGAPKTGHFLGDAKDVIGELKTVDIGIPIPHEESACRLIEAEDLRAELPTRPQNSHKGSYGYVALIGGCERYSGAAKLANLSCAALRVGCGVSTLAVPRSIAQSVAPYLLESTLAPMADDGTGYMTYDPEALDALMQNKKAIAVGMGWGSTAAYPQILAHLLSHFEGTLIIDADGLNTLATMDRALLKNATCRVVLTPHLKEFERLSGIPIAETVKDPLSVAERFAKESGVCLLLKGCTTVVTNGAETYLCDRGCAGMATAGSGDVLSGILTGLLGYLPASPLSVACGAYLAGRAGELAEAAVGAISMIASDTVNALPRALSEILSGTDEV